MADENSSNGPPAGVPVSELWAALTAIPVPHGIVDFPIKDPIMGQSIGKVAVVPLGLEEMMICQTVAGDFARKLTKESPKAGEESPHYRQVFSDEAAIQILWRALKDPADKTLEKPAIPAPVNLRRKPFSADVIGVLLKTYFHVCSVHGPIVATMSDEERNAWLDALEAGGAAYPLDLLTLATLTELLMHSVSRCRAFRMGSGSAGQAPTDTSPASAPPPEQSPDLPESEEPPIAVSDDVVIPKP